MRGMRMLAGKTKGVGVVVSNPYGVMTGFFKSAWSFEHNTM